MRDTVLLLVLGIVSLSLGILVGDTLQSSDISAGDTSLPYEENLSSGEGVYSLPYSNRSGLHGGEGSDLPLFYWETNSKGLREEEFNAEKPPNTTRILIIGDSMTWGSGVNKSDRYTDRFEGQMNNASDEHYQVINAGVPAWGMKDYYLFLENRGVEYNPDIVVIAFSFPQDALSREKGVELYRQANASVDESKRYWKVRMSPERKEKIEKRVARERREFFSNVTFDSSNVPRYMGKILRLNRESDAETVFFAYESIWRGRPEVKSWMEENEASVVWAPSALDRENPDSQKYRFERDPHYNSKGHELLSQKLFRYFNRTYIS